ncbi:MAG: aminotransferase class IV, partial [Clostridia bacterium]|nr:aminotransferase class IV [Clostridia bacterium]
MLNIRIEKTANPKAKPTDETALGFGKIFTDHMAIIDWNMEKGWYDARIVPFENFSMHPAATCLHYGSEIFEGLKAYRTAEGRIQMFRPEENAARMMRSADRLCLPQLPVEDFMQILKTFVELEAEWTPHSAGTSLYLRPFMYGDDETLGVHAVKHAVFCIIASPVGSYYKEGINPVGIMIEDQDVRAVRGGTGYAKCGGNYAASNRAGERAAQKGYSQVL